MVNASAVAGGTLPWSEFAQRLEQLSPFLLWRSDGSRMLNHASFREWLVWREEGQDDRFLCDPRCMVVERKISLRFVYAADQRVGGSRGKKKRKKYFLFVL